MPETRVISLKGRIGEFGPRLERAPKGLLYVGRVNKRGKNRRGWNLDQSPFANLHSIKQYGLAGALDRYVRDLIDRPDLVEAIRGHAGGIFACWCGDDPGISECHAASLAFVADGGDPHHLISCCGVARPADAGECGDLFFLAFPSRPVHTVAPAGAWAGAL